MVVSAGPQKTGAGGHGCVLRRRETEVLEQRMLTERRSELELSPRAQRLRHAVEQLVDPIHADALEHRANLLRGVRRIAHLLLRAFTLGIVRIASEVYGM